MENWDVTIISYVDAQNSFGAMTRSSFAIKIQYGGGQTPHYIEFDGEILRNV